jgi:pimeloyl-ACP methyl ester carboxylesterase
MEIISLEINLISDNLKLTGYLSYPSSGTNFPGVLFIHGGGKYTDNLYSDWQSYLGKRGFASLFFYCRGVGVSEGDFTDSSLVNRLSDAIAAYNYFINSGIVDPNRICVYGSSMGGHVAVRLIEKYPRIKTLVLQSAAAYSVKAEKLQLTSQFTQEITRSNSWSESVVFDMLKTYSGKTLIIYGEKDEVIPDGIKNKFKEMINHNNFIILKNGTHRLLRPETDAEKKANLKMFHKVSLFLKNNLSG